MAKEKMNNGTRIICTVLVTILAIGGVFTTCGLLMGSVSNNAEGIKLGAQERKEIEIDVVDLKIRAERHENLSEVTLTTLVNINDELKTIRSTLSKQATFQAVISEKLKDK